MRVENLRSRVREIQESRRQNVKKASKPPRYDTTYFKAVEWLNSQ
jgi:hypothetical protein